LRVEGRPLSRGSTAARLTWVARARHTCHDPMLRGREGRRKGQKETSRYAKHLLRLHLKKRGTEREREDRDGESGSTCHDPSLVRRRSAPPRDSTPRGVQRTCFRVDGSG
jgi:hypothetical protein